MNLVQKIKNLFNKRKRNFYDSFYFNYNETKKLIKNSISNSKGFDTAITIKCLNNGKLTAPVVETTNTTAYNGRLNMQYVFGHEANPTKHLSLNDIYDIPHSLNVYEDEKYRLRSIKYFCIGNGAESKTVKDSIIPARSSDSKLYNMVPFRCVPINSDLSDEEREKYKLRKIITIKDQQYIAYYAKALSSSTLSVTYNNQDYVPKETDTSTLPDTDPDKPLKTGGVTTATVLSLEIDTKDFKEYYKALKNGSLVGASLNEFGLIYAYEAPNTLENSKAELAGAELFSKIVHSNIRYESDGSESQFTYQIGS